MLEILLKEVLVLFNCVQLRLNFFFWVEFGIRFVVITFFIVFLCFVLDVVIISYAVYLLENATHEHLLSYEPN